MPKVDELFPRGVIQNRARKRQILNFEGMRYGKITPSDIDGLLDWSGNRFAWFELKLGDAQVPYGQNLALQNLNNALEDGGRRSAVFVAQHGVFNCDEDVPVHLAYVRSIYSRHQWTIPQVQCTLRQAVDAFLYGRPVATYVPYEPTKDLPLFKAVGLSYCLHDERFKEEDGQCWICTHMQ